MPLLRKIRVCAVLFLAALMLAACAGPNITGSPQERLFLAAQSGNRSVLRKAILDGADVNAQGPDGTALFIAAQNGKENVALELLRHDADINAQSYDEGLTALMAAAQNGHAGLVKTLINEGANTELLSYPCAKEGGKALKLNDALNFKKEFQFALTALMFAAAEGHDNVVTALIDAGADVNAQGSFGVTALSVAAAEGHASVVQALIKAGADVSKQIKIVVIDALRHFFCLATLA